MEAEALKSGWQSKEIGVLRGGGSGRSALMIMSSRMRMAG
jgi:hypothetical protein